MRFSISRRACAEFIGTALLVTAVIGSGIMGERLAAGNVAIALLANSVATGAALVALIASFAPISGAHFNPLVTVADTFSGALAWTDVFPYILAQFAGGVAGTLNSHFMFGLPAISLSRHARNGPAQLYAEIVATFGLVAVISACAKLNARAIPIAIGGYIAAAYWFTSSTSFANPAVAVARCLTDTFAGIRPSDVPGFVFAEIIGGAAALLLFRWLNIRASVQEVAHSSKDHSHAETVSGGDDVVIAN
ncbi:MAG TPA: MIP/aquaporin family protein [Candidatus Acidoferrum sp.]|jgi:glycerol uptake facilitator-like aquaporin